MGWGFTVHKKSKSIYVMFPAVLIIVPHTSEWPGTASGYVWYRGPPMIDGLAEHHDMEKICGLIDSILIHGKMAKRVEKRRALSD